MSHGPPTFLRELLKTPQFSANSPSQHSSTVPVASRQVSFKEASSLSVNKENLRSSMRSSSQASYTANQHFGLGNGYYLSQTGPVSKAQSLVAASSHHAQGYLPQYKGLGRTQSSDYNVRYQMPQPYSNIQGGYLRNPRAGLASYSSRRYPPQYDGGADSPPHHPKDNSDAANGTDTKKGTEISPQAFQVDNGKLPAGHSYAVDRLFQTIREAERKEIDAHDQKAAKRT